MQKYVYAVGTTALPTDHLQAKQRKLVKYILLDFSTKPNQARLWRNMLIEVNAELKHREQCSVKLGRMLKAMIG